MFTPPPSPLPSEARQLKLSKLLDEKNQDHDDDNDDSGASSPSSPSQTRPMPIPKLPSQSRRRIVIPLIAVVFVLISVSTRLTVTDRPLSHFTSSLFSLPTYPQRNQHADSTPLSFSSSLEIPSRTLTSHQAHAELLIDKHHRRQASPTSTTDPSATLAPAIPNPPFPVPTPFPQPYDTSFSSNFSTESCQTFFATGFLSNSTFRTCRAFSLLLPSSQEFSAAQKNLTLLTSIIGGTCSTTPTVDTCVRTMDWLALEMQKDTVCGQDLKDKNAMALKAWSGFRNYKLMRDAGCLINQRTNTYCFVDAVAASNPSDFYFYSLPLNVHLPNRTVPSCSSCVQSLMSIYAVQATNTSKAISKTYPEAADKVVKQCGASYAKIVTTSGAGSRLGNLSPGTVSGLLALAAAIGMGTSLTI